MEINELVAISERLGLAVLIGSTIGTNRHLHDQPAGLRTHGLVALGAALAAMMVSPLSANGMIAIDAVSRVIQGVLTGVGFLGAGVILRRSRDNHVHGLTTAAAIWVTAVFGTLCGIGRIDIALLGFLIVLIVLLIGGPIENAVHRRFGASAKVNDPHDSV